MIHQCFSKAAACAAIFAACAGPAIAAGVDPSTFDVAGVKLGMTADEVQTKIAQHFGVGKNKLNTMSVPLKGGKRAITIVSYEANGEHIQVDFSIVSASPDDPVPASAIMYNLTFSSENARQLRAAAIQKYGTPTLNNVLHAQWCVKLTNPGVGCDDGQATLSINSTDLTLTDDRYTQKYLKMLDEQRNRTPRL
ncbi:hypothetical protein LMG29542_05508 [Paraburkholderia humisilvae]|uniref:Lipoprotein n=2 Tax=Paraburkholderia humisilvae TaxID=627669 RepID=A0A6J5EMV7_9BURK|nr:hypothetical protein LMG29542_05508 [Paraburkholderia humisilvae]